MRLLTYKRDRNRVIQFDDQCWPMQVIILQTDIAKKLYTMNFNGKTS